MPENSSGSRSPNHGDASTSPRITRWASSTNPYRISPAAQIALSCGHTPPQWYEIGL